MDASRGGVASRTRIKALISARVTKMTMAQVHDKQNENRAFGEGYDLIIHLRRQKDED